MVSTVQLHLGDCLDFMRGLPDESVDAVITDPLYSEVTQYVFLENLKCLKPAGNGLAFVNAKWISKIIRAMKTELPLFTYLNPAGAGMNGRVITKTHYVIWWGSGKLVGYLPDGWLSTAWSAPYLNEHKWAKNPKYIRMQIMATTREGDTVADPFMGSGLVGVECVRLGRNYIGCEIAQGDFAIAQKRIAEAQLQYRMELTA